MEKGMEGMELERGMWDLGFKMLPNMVAERRFSRREVREKWGLAPLQGPGPL